MNTPFFSIVISVYNKEKYISQTIRSVLDQTYPNFEIIIVNDGSTDKSLEKIETFNDDRISQVNQKNQGASAARNNGMKAAKAEYIALLDGDDIWKENYLETIYKAIGAHPKQSVFATAIAHRYESSIVPVTYVPKIKKEVEIKDYFAGSLKHQLLTSSSIVFKKDILNRTGYFDEEIVSGQDTDLWIRIGLNYPIVFINKILVHYRYDSQSLSNTTFDLDRKPKYDKYAQEENNHPQLKRYLDKNRFSLAILSRLYEDKKSYTYYRKQIDIKNLGFRRRLLIYSPKWLLNLLLDTKKFRGRKPYFKPLNTKKSS